MAHNLTIRREGKVEMAYTGAAPWHHLGTELPADAPISDWIVAAGAEWDICSSPVQYVYEKDALTPSTIITATDRRVLHRSDNGAALGIVSTDYKPVQPHDTIEFFRDLIENLGLKMATAGTLFGGRRFWASGYIDEDCVIDNRDVVRGYVLLSTSADGSMATTGRYTSTRVVCDNTLRMALSEGATSIRTIHSTKFDAASAKKAMGLAPVTFHAFMNNMRNLAKTELSEDAATDLTKTLAGEGPVADRIMEFFNGEALGADYEGAEGTAWGWLNAVTQFADHDRKAKSDSHRLSSLFFGSASRLKDRALELVS